MPSPLDESGVPNTGFATLAHDLLDARHDADDVAQDVWLLLERQPPGRVRNLRSWLEIAIRHIALRSRQRDRRRVERERIVARLDRAPSVLEHLERESQRELLTELVNRLGEPYREVIRLRYLEDREIEEIAAEIGRSPGTVRSQLKRGLDQLRVRMGAEPGMRGRFSLFLPWFRRRGAECLDRRACASAGTRPAIVLGAAACVLVLGVFVLSSRSGREQLVDSRPRPEGRPELALIDPAPPRGDGRSVVFAETSDEPVGTPEPERDSWGIDVEGDVLESEGPFVPGAAILVGNQNGSETRIAARADGLGHYRIRGADRRLLIWAEDPERISSRRHLLGSKRPEGQLDLLLGEPLGTLIGTVLSFNQRPVERAEVRLQSKAPRFQLDDQGTLSLGPPSIRVWTAADGRFRLGRPPNTQIGLLVHAAGHSPFFSTFSTAPGAFQEIEISLPSPCALEGQLLRPDGDPAAGARLGLVFPEPLPGREATVGDTGLFRFEGLPAGPYALRLVEDPAGSSASCFVEGELVAGQRVRHALTLREEHTLRGRVLDGDLPLAGWIVELEERRLVVFPPDVRRVQTLDDGSFAFPSCAPAGSHLLRLFEPGDTSAMPCAVVREVRAGEDEVVLRPAEGASLPGSLVGRFESTSPSLRPVLASLRSDSYSDPLLLCVDRAGGFSAPSLPPGMHRLLGWVPGLGIGVAELIEILPEQRTELVARVPDPGSLRIHVEVPASASGSVSWDRLNATIATPSFHESNVQCRVLYLRKCPEQGSFLVDLFPGEYVYLVTYAGAQYESRSIRIESGRTTTDTVVLQEVVLMTLHLLLPRRLHQAERVSLVMGEGNAERKVELSSASRKGLSETFRLSLTRSTRELRVESSRGLAGGLALTEADIVPGGELRVNLEEAEND